MGTTPQGDSSFAGIDFEVVNRSANPVVVGGQTYAVGDVVMTITTDENGHASTGSEALPYGTYEVKESATNESMLRSQHDGWQYVQAFNELPGAKFPGDA